MYRSQSCIYFFRSLDGLCPDILLQRDVPLILGRGPTTRIKDSKLSRHQVRITWTDKGIFLKQLASNPSYLNTRPLAKLILKTDYIGVPISKHDTVTANAEPRQSENGANSSAGQETKNDRGHWNYGLLQSMNNPELKVLEKSDHAVIKDKYPKAEHHFLILPLERIQNCASLTPDHIPLLRNMVQTGWELADKHPRSNFKLGFHAIPSMSQVHLHVISQDFNSDKLKTKKHWNSFTTDYFINPEIIIDKLKTKGRYVPISKVEGDELLKKDLECHICQHKPKNIPDLKEHLKSH